MSKLNLKSSKRSASKAILQPTKESTGKIKASQKDKNTEAQPLALEMIYTGGAFNGCW
jgi:hypothetical protein